MTLTLHTIKLALLVFWSLWLSIVFMTNAFEGLILINVLPQSWKFASKNFQSIKEATAKYALTAKWAGILFFGVVIWQAAAAVFFWLAVAGFLRGHTQALYSGFFVSLSFWMAIMIADELFKAYEKQISHLLVFSAQLISMLVILALP